VTFHYKRVPQGPRQYGLIAEEVVRVYPEVVLRKTKGRIEGIQYEELTQLVLNELQY
jgi:Chaperone of endosialidase